jgi:formate dehydrogenase subunit gamma
VPQQKAKDVSATRVEEIIGQSRGLEGPLLPILHDVQEEFGYVPAEALPLIADALNISNAEVHGVVSFYHDFRRQPAGRHILKLCRAEACQSMGSDSISSSLQTLLGAGMGETSADGAVTIEAVYCLGLCSCAPAGMLDGAPIGRLNDERIIDIISQVRG